MPLNRKFLFYMRDINQRLNAGVSLALAAEFARRSRFQFHRMFRRLAGETLKHYTLRLRLERAAARLIAGDETVLGVALANGFASHEVFTRAFRRRFGSLPSQYRARISARVSKARRSRHFELTKAIGPCIRFFHYPMQQSEQRNRFRRPNGKMTMPILRILRKEIAPQHILFIRRRIAPGERKDTLGECFGKLFSYGAKAALPIAGWPLCRLNMGPGLLTIEPAMPLTAPASGEGEIQSGMLPGGDVAFGIHAGPYEGLGETHAAIERWIEANGFRPDGAPWEQYVTDPGEHPNPADWRTEVYWPLAK
ncbi:MAG TPA: AraC family transcriptional regulator [Steroidobacteraceae bacterium]|jgi:AraC family transcriptional regulator|nr:AraC family transcriptional regulator [Steroidobacteraceae bacterium]